jgi:alpha-1,6-mannosyltransferase
MVSHESLYGLFRVAGLPGPLARWATTRINRRTVRVYDAIVCTTAWASRDFDRSTTVRVPLGVDRATFHRIGTLTELRRRYASRPGSHRPLWTSVEPRSDRSGSIEALARLRAWGVDAVLVVAGDGPLRRRLVRRAAALPVNFLAFVPDKLALAALLATADVAVAPGPIETFGLAALEALACGTPVVVDAASALPEVIGPEAGASVEGEGRAFAAGIEEVLSRPATRRRQAARDRAEQFDWGTSVAGFLAIHAGETDPNRPVWMESPRAR